MPAPKRFPDRDEIAAVRAEIEPLESGGAARREAAARRPGDGAAGDGEARLPRPRRPLRAHPADVRHGPDGRRGRAPRRHRRSGGEAREVPPGRAVARGRRPRDAGAEREPASGHVSRPHRPGDALPQEVPRSPDERRRARALPASRTHRHGDPAVPRRGGIRRGRDAGAPTPLRRSVRAAVPHALERARSRPLPPDRDRALSQAPDRRWPRAGVRDREGLPEREHLVQAPAGVHDARVVRGVRGLPRCDGSDRDDARACRARGSRQHAGSASGGTTSI